MMPKSKRMLKQLTLVELDFFKKPKVTAEFLTSNQASSTSAGEIEGLQNASHSQQVNKRQTPSTWKVNLNDSPIEVQSSSGESILPSSIHCPKKMPNLSGKESVMDFDLDVQAPSTSEEKSALELKEKVCSLEVWDKDIADSDKDLRPARRAQDKPSFYKCSDPDLLIEKLISFNRTPECRLPLQSLSQQQGEDHTIICHTEDTASNIPLPLPDFSHMWDTDHVRIYYPCYDENPTVHHRWQMIEESLSRCIESSYDLQDAIMSYNTESVNKWNFDGLHAFMNLKWTEDERNFFFQDILPRMQERALTTNDNITKGLPLLKKLKDQKTTMSQSQVSILLINAFFCTFPRRKLDQNVFEQHMTSECDTYPHINFNRLYAGSEDYIPRINAEKLKCIFNYFRRVIFDAPLGRITFHRQVILDDQFPEWNLISSSIQDAVVSSSGVIEVDGHGMLEVDFANKYVGGGVLGSGSLQEEIKFLICPELIVSRLFVESLGKNEVLLVKGAEQFNKYKGYANEFCWDGDFQDETPRDSWGRRCTEMVAMDAKQYKVKADQYKLRNIKRDLNKAYCGFFEPNTPPQNLPAVATGNWGCGAFNGDPHLKFVIQLIASSAAGRNMVYFTFGNKKLKKDLHKLYTLIKEKNLHIGDLWSVLCGYAERTCNEAFMQTSNVKTFYDFFISAHSEGETCFAKCITQTIR